MWPGCHPIQLHGITILPEKRSDIVLRFDIVLCCHGRSFQGSSIAAQKWMCGAAVSSCMLCCAGHCRLMTRISPTCSGKSRSGAPSALLLTILTPIPLPALRHLQQTQLLADVTPHSCFLCCCPRGHFSSAGQAESLSSCVSAGGHLQSAHAPVPWRKGPHTADAGCRPPEAHHYPRDQVPSLTLHLWISG